jgi:LAO/AO transport system kinase
MIRETDLPVEKWAGQIRAGDIRAISRGLSAIESRVPEAEKLLQILFSSSGNAYRIGITGAPGTGKSTLVDCLTGYYRDQQKTVGILAVDPSSPFTGGAILGDRIRMQSHAADPGVFVRSVATRGHLGGLAQAVGDAALLLDAAGKDVILIETVGVGQGEVDIMGLADCTLVVLMPGMGDGIQGLKAGVMEIGDIFVLNKSDYDNADQFEGQIRASLELAPVRDGWTTPLVRTVAAENKGTVEVARQIALFREHAEKFPRSELSEVARWKGRLLAMLKERLMERFLINRGAAKNIEVAASEVAARQTDPITAVNKLLDRTGY